MNNYVLYALTVLIWGSTWLAIKYQLGDVDPMVSVVYRFALAALLLLIYCRMAGLKMRFTLKEHLFLALQGGLLFSLNYWLVYLAEVYLQHVSNVLGRMETAFPGRFKPARKTVANDLARMKAAYDEKYGR